jgi:hypothetical protein
MATRSVAHVVVRWIARVWSVLSILAVIAFAVGEVGGKGPRPTLQEWVGLALWPIGVGLGLIVAWYREELGGVFALGCVLAFYVWNVLRYGQLPRGPFFILMAAPGVFFLVAGLLSRRNAAQES